MDDSRVCTPLLAESDAQNDTSRTYYDSSVTDADKVINTNIDSTKFEGVKSDADLLKDLLADDYCHVCEAVLLFESQRLSHYEGKRHAQRVRVYLQAKRAEKTKKEAAAAQRTLTTDKDQFCGLCNMVFSSHIVAASHYEGKVHAKNIRKQGLQTLDRQKESLPAVDALSKPARDASADPLDPQVSASPGTEADLKDPNKYCSLCAATFNNPHMALQHYNGRKHQRNLSRQELLKGVEDHIKQADGLLCQICGVRLNSVEMYQAHMQGNKHLSRCRQKKVIHLCKSQQKVYHTFADELSDYIQIQKARGISPRRPALPPADGQQGEDRQGEDHADLTNPPLNYNPPSLIVSYGPAGRRPPPHLDPFRPSRSLDLSSPLPILRRRRRKPSSSSASSSSYSSSSSSSSSSSDSSSTSDGEDSERRTEKRRRKRTKREEAGKEKGRKWWKREKLGDSEERRRRTRKSQGRQRGQDKRHQAEDAVPVPVPKEGETDEPSGQKNRKEKKKTKGDTRTEEERLWDDSILGF